MARRGTAQTLSSDVYEQLRDAILGGQVLPGSRLRPADLRTRYDVSLSVVREALMRLVEQRLVVTQPNLGFSVAPLSLTHLQDLVQARCIVEGSAIRASVQQGNLEWESRVLAIHHRLERTPIWLGGEDPTLNGDWVSAHAAFHATLIEACDNEILLGLCASLFDMAELYRRWNEAGERRSREVVQEHRDLAAAALEHNGPLAEQLLVEHITHTADLAVHRIPALGQSG